MVNQYNKYDHIIIYLIKKKANINVINRYNTSAIGYHISNINGLKITKYLIKSNTIFNLKNTFVNNILFERYPSNINYMKLFNKYVILHNCILYM